MAKNLFVLGFPLTEIVIILFERMKNTITKYEVNYLCYSKDKNVEKAKMQKKNGQMIKGNRSLAKISAQSIFIVKHFIFCEQFYVCTAQFYKPSENFANVRVRVQSQTFMYDLFFNIKNKLFCYNLQLHL